MKASLAAILAALFFLSACGGGSGGSGDVAENKVQLGVYVADQLVDQQFELFRFDTSGAGAVRLSGALQADGNVGNFFKISPDGSRVAYRADQETDEKFELYVARLDGSGIDKINEAMIANGDVSEFAWSPDSAQIVYVADAEQDGVREVYLANADGSNHLKINGSVGVPGVVQLSDVKWSPDGRYIAQQVQMVSSGQTVGINTHDTQNPNSIRVNPTLAIGGSIGVYAWSPDSSRIAYRADQDIVSVFELYSATPDGTVNDKLNGALLMPGGGVARNFAWSPDSSRIAYFAVQDTVGVLEFYSATPDGAVNDKLNGALLVPGGGVVGNNLAWSPDSRRIAYHADQDTDGVFELYSATPDGAVNDKLNGALVTDGDVSGFAWSPR